MTGDFGDVLGHCTVLPVCATAAAVGRGQWWGAHVSHDHKHTVYISHICDGVQGVVHQVNLTEQDTKKDTQHTHRENGMLAKLQQEVGGMADGTHVCCLTGYSDCAGGDFQFHCKARTAIIVRILR